MRATVGGIELEYEKMGGGTPILLIMGLGAQLILWPEEFCLQLVKAGFSTIRYDNRDIGLSTKATGKPPLGRLIAEHLLQRSSGISLPYTLEDLAKDACGLMDALQIPAAHVVGASMGGMVAQLLALNHPDRVKSLGLIMTTPGGRWLGKPGALAALLKPRGKGREAVIEGNIQMLKSIGGDLPVDPARLRQLCEVAYDRSYHPAGFLRQFAAVLAASDRKTRLSRLSVPTVVIHGSVDPLVPIAAGKALAAAIPGSRFVEVAGMGHSLPPSAWPTLLDALIANARHGDAVLQGGG